MDTHAQQRLVVLTHVMAGELWREEAAAILGTVGPPGQTAVTKSLAA